MLKMIVSSLDDVEETDRKHYTERDGKFVCQVEGAKSQIDIDKLMKAANDERGISKDLKKKLELWGDLDPEEVRPLLDKLPELEAQVAAGKSKLDDQQIQAVLNGRIAPLQRDLEKKAKDLAEAQAAVAKYETENRRRLIHDAVRSVAAEAGAHETAYSTPLGGLMLLADNLFEVSESGEAVVKEGAPGLLHGTSVKDAIAVLQSSHSYLFKASNGGGSNGNTGNNAPVSNPFKTNNMTLRSEFVRSNKDKPQVVERALQEAGLEHAGSKYVGG